MAGLHEEHLASAWLGGVKCQWPRVFNNGRWVGEVFCPLFWAVPGSLTSDDPSAPAEAGAGAVGLESAAASSGAAF